MRVNAHPVAFHRLRLNRRRAPHNFTRPVSYWPSAQLEPGIPLSQRAQIQRHMAPVHAIRLSQKDFIMTAVIQETPAQARAASEPESFPMSGIVDIADGHAFIRTAGYRRSPSDVYVSAGQIRKYGLRPGDQVQGVARPAGRGAKF